MWSLKTPRLCRRARMSSLESRTEWPGSKVRRTESSASDEVATEVGGDRQVHFDATETHATPDGLSGIFKPFPVEVDVSTGLELLVKFRCDLMPRSWTRPTIGKDAQSGCSRTRRTSSRTLARSSGRETRTGEISIYGVDPGGLTHQRTTGWPWNMLRGAACECRPGSPRLLGAHNLPEGTSFEVVAVAIFGEVSDRNLRPQKTR